LVVAITYPLLISIYGSTYFDVLQTGFIAGPADFLISWILPSIAVIVFWVFRQATPGKMVVRARILDATTGEPPTTAQFVGRYVAYFVSMIPLCLGYLWVAFDGRKQGWHDKLAGTVVVRQKRRGPEAVKFGRS
jgi:uncharacterized RDD family membrane protein YckC